MELLTIGLPLRTSSRDHVSALSEARFRGRVKMGRDIRAFVRDRFAVLPALGHGSDYPVRTEAGKFLGRFAEFRSGRSTI